MNRRVDTSMTIDNIFFELFFTTKNSFLIFLFGSSKNNTDPTNPIVEIESIGDSARSLDRLPANRANIRAHFSHTRSVKRFTAFGNNVWR